jgi:hypothetical protein
MRSGWHICKMASERAGIDAGEIPRVDRAKTQQSGVEMASAKISGSIDYVELGPVRVECMLSEISAEMASGRAGVPTRPRFLASTETKRSRMALEIHLIEDLDLHTTHDSVWRG